MRIHHATLAKAKKFNITLTIEDNEVVATAKDGTRLASGLQGNKVLEDAITKMTGKPAKGAAKAEKPVRKPRRASRDEEESEEETGEEETGDESDALADEIEAEGGAGIVKDKYKKLYAKNGGNCGDDLAKLITEHVDNGAGQTDKAKLKRFAEANGAWKPMYGSFKTKHGAWNAGLARMNVSNILRGKQRKAKANGEAFEIEWA